jgi:hypothetical protein
MILSAVLKHAVWKTDISAKRHSKVIQVLCEVFFGGVCFFGGIRFFIQQKIAQAFLPAPRYYKNPILRSQRDSKSAAVFFHHQPNPNPALGRGQREARSWE